MKAGCIYLSPDGYKSYGWLDTSTRAIAVQAHFSHPDAVAAYLLSEQRTTATILYDDSPFNRDPLGTFERVIERYGPVVRLLMIEPQSITHDYLVIFILNTEVVKGDNASWQCTL
jgi:hypothetical protein